MRGALPLCTPQYAGAPPCTRVTFSPMRKSPKNLQGLRPLESPSAESPPLLRSLTHRAGLPSATKIDRFATLRWWANRSFFSHQLSARRYFLLSIRGTVGLSPRMPLAFLLATNAARAQGRGDQRGLRPLRRRSRNQAVPGEGVGAVLPPWGAQRGRSPLALREGMQRGGAPRKRKPCQMLNLTLNKPAPQYRGVAVNDAGLPRCGRALRRIKDHLRPPVVQQGDRRGGVRRAGTHLY